MCKFCFLWASFLDLDIVKENLKNKIWRWEDSSHWLCWVQLPRPQYWTLSKWWTVRHSWWTSTLQRTPFRQAPRYKKAHADSGHEHRVARRLGYRRHERTPLRLDVLPRPFDSFPIAHRSLTFPVPRCKLGALRSELWHSLELDHDILRWLELREYGWGFKVWRL